MKQSEQNSLVKIGVRIGLAAVLLAGTIWYLQVQRNPEKIYDIKTIPPTCTESGYSLYTHRLTGATTVNNVVEPVPYFYGQWELYQEQTEILPEIQVRKCENCDQEEFEKIYPDIGLPRITIYGDLTGIGKKRKFLQSQTWLQKRIRWRAISLSNTRDTVHWSMTGRITRSSSLRMRAGMRKTRWCFLSGIRKISIF